MDDIILKEDFFSQDLLSRVTHDLDQLSAGNDAIDPQGIWKGRKIATQRKVLDQEQTPAIKEMLDMIQPEFDCEVEACEVVDVLLFLPWDIHTDSKRRKCPESYYNILVPLRNSPSQTIIFNEYSEDYKDFYLYKESHAKLAEPVPKEIWDEYLSMCWPEDREWLSIKTICPPQRIGQLIGFKSKFFHSSDNFHTRTNEPKRFMQLIYKKVDTK